MFRPRYGTPETPQTKLHLGSTPSKTGSPRLKLFNGLMLALRTAVIIILALTPVAAAWALARQPQTYEEQRAGMVEVIERHADDVLLPGGRTDLDPRVLDVMTEVPRHEFVPASRRRAAYDDMPVPIGYGQTISQPFIVALMTALLEVDENDVVLEVGTGSGYQAAVLSGLAESVCSVEIIPELSATATEVLEKLGYENVRTRVGDGYYGWPDCGPFDAIVVTAATPSIPPPLIQQLKPGGRMVIPLGGPFTTQQLVLARKEADGRLTTWQILPVMFVPLTPTRGA